jgi:hypothetical protein
VRRRLDGRALHLQLQAQAKQLERTASISAEVPQLQEAADLLLRAAQDAASRFVEVRKTLVEVARMIPIDCTALRDAETLAVEFDLVLPDAVMLASVLADAAAKPSSSVFINRNTKDFDDPDIKRRLEQEGCKLVWKFDDGLAYVTSCLAKADP